MREAIGVNPVGPGQIYNERKLVVMDLVPPGE